MHALRLGHGGEFNEKHHPLVAPEVRSPRRAHILQLEARQLTPEQFYNGRLKRDAQAIGHTLLTGAKIVKEYGQRLLHELSLLSSEQTIEIPTPHLSEQSTNPNEERAA